MPHPTLTPIGRKRRPRSSFNLGDEQRNQLYDAVKKRASVDAETGQAQPAPKGEQGFTGIKRTDDTSGEGLVARRKQMIGMLSGDITSTPVRPRSMNVGPLKLNTSGNKRSGLHYRDVMTSKGVLHDYAGTKNDTLVKRKRQRNPSRQLH